MSTSKVRVKLAKERRSARKGTSTEAARIEPEPEPTKRSTAETQAATQRGTVTAGCALTCTQFVCFCHWLSGQKLFAGFSLFTYTFQSRRQARLAHRGRQRWEPLRAASLNHRNVPLEPPQLGNRLPVTYPPQKFGQIFTLFFYRAVSGPKKRKRQATTDPDSETTTSSDSDSSSTVDTSTSEDEKDFILPDYPSDELTSYESSDSEPQKYPRPHQQREQRTFLHRAFPRRRFLGTPVPPNKPEG